MEENRESDNNNNSTTTTTSQQRQQQQLGNNNNRTNNINHRHNSHDRRFIPLDVLLALPAAETDVMEGIRQLDARRRFILNRSGILNRENQRWAALQRLFNPVPVDDDDSHDDGSLPNRMGHTSDDVDQLFNPVPVDDEDDDSQYGSMPGLRSDTESEDSDGLPDLDDEAQLG